MRAPVMRWLQALSLTTMGGMALQLLQLRPVAGLLLYAAIVVYIFTSPEPER